MKFSSIFKHKPDAVGVFGNELTAKRSVSVGIEEFLVEDGVQKVKLKVVPPNGQILRFTLAKTETATIEYSITMTSNFTPSSVEDGR